LKWQAKITCKIGTLKKSDKECTIVETVSGMLVIWYEAEENEDFGVT